MPFYFFVWDKDTIEHLVEHDVSPDEFERIVQNSDDRSYSRSSGRPIAFGEADDGRWLCCVYEFIDETTVLPCTAFEVEGY